MQERLQYNKITQPYMVDAFYLADQQDEHLIDDVISIWTGIFPCNWGTPGLSHEERGPFVDKQLKFFSATSRKELGTNNTTGTRWIDGEQLLRHPERWRFLISPKMTRFDIACEINRANSLLGRLYDFIGVGLDFIRLGILWNKRKKIYCSKTCNYMHLKKFQRISPRRRWKILTKKYGYREITLNELREMEKIDTAF